MIRSITFLGIIAGISGIAYAETFDQDSLLTLMAKSKLSDDICHTKSFEIVVYFARTHGAVLTEITPPVFKERMDILLKDVQTQGVANWCANNRFLQELK